MERQLQQMIKDDMGIEVSVQHLNAMSQGSKGFLGKLVKQWAQNQANTSESEVATGQAEQLKTGTQSQILIKDEVKTEENKNLEAETNKTKKTEIKKNK